MNTDNITVQEIERKIFKNKKRIVKNIKAIRCYLQLDRSEFAKLTGTGKRGMELESGRFRPSIQEIEAIAKIAEVKPENIINYVLYLTLSIT